MTVSERLRDAMNAHDLDAFLDCFHEDSGASSRGMRLHPKALRC